MDDEQRRKVAKLLRVEMRQHLVKALADLELGKVPSQAIAEAGSLSTTVWVLERGLPEVMAKFK
jgi:hypothetical protein